jgi:Lipase (class 3)
MPLTYDPSRRALYSPARHDTVFECDRVYSPLQLAVEAARLAYYRAETLDSEHRRLKEALARVGFFDPALFVDAGTDSEAFAARRDSDGTTLLSFRGTQPDHIRDLITGARAELVAWPESAGRVHGGFAAAARALMPQIRPWIASAKADPRKLILTGHGFGAALATLAATAWRPAWLVTLGSPRVGDGDFAATLGATNVVRLVDCCDAVTGLPPPRLGYVHVRAGTYLTRRAETLENPATALVRSDQRRARVSYLFRYAWRFGAVSRRDYADHAPINYARAFFPD